MKKINALALVMLIVLSYALTIFVACNPYATKPQKPTEHKHSLTYVAAVEETCTQDGMMEHWDCDSCGKTFSDSKGEHEVQKSSLVVSAHHTLTHKTEQKATCTADGNIDYYHCSACGENFLDENGKNRVDLDDTVLASKGHVVGDQWEHDKNGHWKVCSACHNVVEYAPHNFEDYVCKDCGAEDEQNKPLSEEEKTTYIDSAIQNNIKTLLGRTTTAKNYFAIDFKFEDNQYICYALINYSNTLNSNGLALISIPMTSDITDENIKNQTLSPTSSTAGEIELQIPYEKQNELVPQILDKLSIDEKFDYVGIANRGNLFSAELGDSTSGITFYMLNESHIQTLTVYLATQSGAITDTTDLINKQLLNGEIGKTYLIKNQDDPIETAYDFSDNAILNFEALSPEKQAIFNILYAGKKVGYAKGNEVHYQVEQ